MAPLRERALRVKHQPRCADTPALRPLPHPRRSRLSAELRAPTAAPPGRGLSGGGRGGVGGRGSCRARSGAGPGLQPAEAALLRSPRSRFIAPDQAGAAASAPRGELPPVRAHAHTHTHGRGQTRRSHTHSHTAASPPVPTDSARSASCTLPPGTGSPAPTPSPPPTSIAAPRRGAAPSRLGTSPHAAVPRGSTPSLFLPHTHTAARLLRAVASGGDARRGERPGGGGPRQRGGAVAPAGRRTALHAAALVAAAPTRGPGPRQPNASSRSRPRGVPPTPHPPAPRRLSQSPLHAWGWEAGGSPTSAPRAGFIPLSCSSITEPR